MATNDHYDARSDHYEDAFFYEKGEYHEWMVKATVGSLALGGSPGATALTLADVGGGTGHVAADVSAAARGNLPMRQVTVVEPSLAMAAKAAARGLRTEVADAVAWAQGGDQPEAFDRVMFKEVIHHVPLAEAGRMWANALQRRLKPGGRVLVVTRPQHGTDYPFFDGARAAWAAAVPPDACLLDDLAAAGFEHVATDVKAFRCALPASKWLRMVRGRFWSTFDGFSDAELDAGLAEVRAAYVPAGANEDDHVLAFEDRLRFVTATKPYT